MCEKIDSEEFLMFMPHVGVAQLSLSKWNTTVFALKVSVFVKVQLTYVYVWPPGFSTKDGYI